MYTDEDIDAAVAAGALTGNAAFAFRAFITSRRASPEPDEERFRLLTGFNDIFVTLALLLTLAAAAFLAQKINALAVPVVIAGLCWALAEHFTRVRRMALPSIVLLLAFGGATGFTVSGIAAAAIPSNPTTGHGLAQHVTIAILAGITASACAVGLHWWRFHVPITVAVAALLGVAFCAVATADALSYDTLPYIIFVGGVALFALGMWWDASDPARRTRRADVAFWLHLASAPMLVHPVFWLGISPVGTPAGAFAVLVAYAALAMLALVIDRRAILVSALSYALYSASTLYAGLHLDKSYGLPLAGLGMGSILLAMSVWWRSLRALLVSRLPFSMRKNLPAS